MSYNKEAHLFSIKNMCLCFQKKSSACCVCTVTSEMNAPYLQNIYLFKEMNEQKTPRDNPKEN